MVGTLVMLEPENFTISGKAFIQSQIGPTFGSNQVAKPLVEEFMGNITFIRMIQMGAVIVL